MSIALAPGLVVAAHGRHCVVETPDGRRLICDPRGKKSQVVVGDQVMWLAAKAGQGDEGTVEKVLTRRNLFYRQDELRTKSFAANLDQVLILIASEPEFSESQLTRALITAEATGITPLIALNKQDVQPQFDRAWQRLASYRAMGYTVLPLALKPKGDNPESSNELTQHLHGRHTLVLGPSGAGKSTLINRYIPGAQALTNEISQALNSGKHTTTSTSWYWVDPHGTEPRTALIDSPGFQEFGLHHIDPAQLAAYMPDLRPHVAQCRFYNCTHLHEPGCGVISQVKPDSSADQISESRYRIYSELFAELSQTPRY